MQEIIYTNIKGESVNFGASLPFIFVSVTGTENADASRKTLKGALQDGERTVSFLREERQLDVTFNLITYGRAEIYRVRAQLCGVLGAEKAFDRTTGERAKITYRNDLGTWWTWAVPAKMPQWPQRVKDLHANVKVSFDCDSAYWFGMEEKTAGFQASDQGLRLPFAFPLRFQSRSSRMVLLNEGQANAPLRLEVHGQGERPTIYNKTTGQKIHFAEALPTGALLRMNTDPEDLYVLLVQNGTEQNAYGYLDVSTPVSDFYLAPGENEITYDSDVPSSKTAIALAWRERFEGV